MKDGGPSSSSSENGKTSNVQNTDHLPRTDPTLCFVSLQHNGDEETTEEGIKEVLDHNIVVPQVSADLFRQTRGAMVAEAKGQVGSSHLQAMSEANRLLRWALDLETAPAYAPTNREMHQEFVEIF